MPKDLLSEKEPVDLLAEEVMVETPPSSPKRGATFMEFLRQSAGAPLPPDASLTPLQSGLAGFKGGVESTGFGLQQLAGKAIPDFLGGEAIREGIERAAANSRELTNLSSKENPWATGIGGVLGSVGSALPFEAAAALPFISKAAPIAQRGLEGGLFGASQYASPDESRTLNTGIGAASGAIVPEVFRAIGGTAKRVLGKPQSAIAKDIVEPYGLSPQSREKFLKNIQNRTKAAEELGVQLTPGEAIGSANVAKRQATTGKTGKNPAKMEEFHAGRTTQENKAVKDFVEDVGGNISPAESSRAIRKTAQDIAEKQVNKRQAASEPLYQASKNDKIDRKALGRLLQDENITQAINTINKNSAYRQEAKSMAKNSVEYFDLVKKRLDGRINKAAQVGDKEMVRLLKKSKTQLVAELDKVSPAYKQARQTFSTESEVVNEILDSNLGKLAKLKDADLKKVSNMLFDPKDIDPKTLDTLRNRLLKENPDAFYSALKQNMSSKMDTMAKTATKRELPAFYRGILKDDKTYNMYKDSLASNPKALRRLELMKEAFQDLMGDYTPKSAAGLEKTSMSNKRDVVASVMGWIERGGAYDDAAVEFITNPKWNKQAEKILAAKRSQKGKVMLDVIEKIARSKSMDTVKD